MFQNSAKEEHYIHSHQRCPVCHRMADSLEFYYRHIFQLSVVVYFHSKLCKTAVRNFQTGGFYCPWEGCSHHNCDSLAMEGHILHCKYSKMFAE